MIVGIVGIGLIGGSMARAYKEKGHTVYVWDKSESTMKFSMLAGVTDGILNQETISECDLILIALYPSDTIQYMEENASAFNSKTTVIDCCGTKRRVCECGFELAAKYGFTFVGGHPMAGTQFSGFKNSRSDLFHGAPMVIVPPIYDDIAFLQKVKDLLSPAEFGRITVTTADKHDEMIAFTSQMAHIVSNAFIKSPTAQSHQGFSAGSYKDLTRVAWLNETMWSDLFLENDDKLIKELDFFIHSLQEYKEAMQNHNREKLSDLLAEGRILKEKVDGK